MKMSFAKAHRVAAVALWIEVTCGHLAGEPFDSALGKLHEQYDIAALSAKYFGNMEENMRALGLQEVKE